MADHLKKEVEEVVQVVAEQPQVLHNAVRQNFIIPVEADRSFNQNKSFEQRIENQRNRSGFEDNHDRRKQSSVYEIEQVGYQKENSRVIARQNSRPQLVQEPLQSEHIQQNRTFCQKCPSWLKTLLLLIGLIALGGLVYWFFFQRGKVQNSKKHKEHSKEKVNKQKDTVVSPIVQQPIKNQATPVQSQPTVVATPVSVNTDKTQNPVTEVPVQKSTTQTTDSNEKGKKVEQSTPAKAQQNPSTDKIEKTEKSEQSSTIIIPKGNRQSCPDQQFLLNGNCVSCSPGMTWSGLNCVSKTVKHLRRSHYYNI